MCKSKILNYEIKSYGLLITTFDSICEALVMKVLR